MTDKNHIELLTKTSDYIYLEYSRFKLVCLIMFKKFNLKNIEEKAVYDFISYLADRSLIDSFLLHYKVLMDFLIRNRYEINEEGLMPFDKPTHVYACDFLSVEKSELYFKSVTYKKYKDLSLDNRRKSHLHLGDLTIYHDVKQEDWDFSQLTQQVAKLSLHFYKYLDFKSLPEEVHSLLFEIQKESKGLIKITSKNK
ncbi:MAG: hypothetical protein V4642_13105 [Bacteroidota bacterium]